MALGYCEALLMHLKSVNPQNYPGTKVTPGGMVQMLQQTPTNRINETFMNGHKRQGRVKYKVRSVISQVSTSRSCDYNIVPVYKETTADVNQFVQLGIRIDDITIRQYCEDASRTVQAGTPPTTLMAEHLDSILHIFNGLIEKMDTVLLTAMVANFGINVRTGNNATAAINISKDLQIQSLTQGLVQILADYQDNELAGTPNVVGSGLFRNFHMLQQFKQMDFSGINTQAQMNQFNFFYDRKASTIMGTNQIAVVAPGSVQMIEWMQNVGAFAGDKGSSFFGTLTDPYFGIRWDYQFKYVDCPTTYTNAYSGATATIDRGWLLLISKNYDMFVTPSDAYDGADVLHGVNGLLRYTISNACETC